MVHGMGRSSDHDRDGAIWTRFTDFFRHRKQLVRDNAHAALEPPILFVAEPLGHRSAKVLLDFFEGFVNCSHRIGREHSLARHMSHVCHSYMTSSSLAQRKSGIECSVGRRGAVVPYDKV